MRWIPEITYNSGTILTLTFPVGIWKPSERRVGGAGQASNGIGESYVVRRDFLVTIPLRFFESEYDDVMTWIRWAQDHPATPFIYKFAKLEPATAVSVFLQEPLMDKDFIEPERTDYRQLYELEIKLRSATNTSISQRAYD